MLSHPIAATLLVALLAVVAAHGSTQPSAAEMVRDIYDTCLSRFSVGCVRPKALRWISDAAQSPEIRITDDLSIVRTGSEEPQQQRSAGAADARVQLFDQIDGFLATHSLRMSPPAILKTEEARSFGSEQLGLDTALELPLADGNVAEGNYKQLWVIIQRLNNLQTTKQVVASSRR